ncbi:uncharacterized protein LOC125504520 [Dendroctonus ponderosae]|uniref:uncharacterized protein LOC125504520 n=1 Tax=Dendroctonus ponderosae TaxID=77166 RepID=UPI002035BA2A|nr:uncharacterized protein LOC125504520 [Dendroctonus ponderosae]
MAQFKPEYLSCVPQFDGNPSELNRFLATCKSIIDNFYNARDVNCFQNTYLLNSLIGKLTGNARLVVNVQNVSTWDDLKNTLYRNFADRRDESCLNRDLVMLRQQNESPQNFYDKVLEILNLLVSYVDSHDDIASATVKRTVYQKLALKTFLSGLKEPLGNTIRCMRPTDLAEAIQFVTEETNIKYFQSQNNNQVSSKQIDKPRSQPFYNNKPFQPKFFQQPITHSDNTYYPFQRFNQQPVAYNNNFAHNPFNRTPNFPSQPVNIRPNYNLPTPKPFTNSQVFGKPNVFKPDPSKQFPRPTPMSLSTRQSRFNNSTFQQNPNFQSRPRPIIEEIYNTELDTMNESESYEYPDPSNNACYVDPNYRFNSEPQEHEIDDPDNQEIEEQNFHCPPGRNSAT